MEEIARKMWEINQSELRAVENAGKQSWHERENK